MLQFLEIENLEWLAICPGCQFFYLSSTCLGMDASDEFFESDF